MFVSRCCYMYKSGPLKTIGQLSHDGMNCCAYIPGKKRLQDIPQSFYDNLSEELFIMGIQHLKIAFDGKL